MVRPSRGRSSASRGGVPAWAILGLGLLAAAVSLVLLFVPFFDATSSAASMVREQIVQQLHGRGPGFLHLWLHHGYVPTLVLLWLLVLVVLPWRAAMIRQHDPSSDVPGPEEPTRRSGQEGSSSPLVFTDDGGVEDRTHPGSWRIFRSTQELQAIARDAGIPWRAEYETAGGARAFLEILRVVSEEPAPERLEGDRHDPSRSGRATPSTEQEPSGPPEPEGRGPAEPAESQGTVPLAGLGADGGGAPYEDPSDIRATPSSWTPSWSGSVYTSTDLYTSDRLERTADAEDEPSTDSGDRTGGETR